MPGVLERQAFHSDQDAKGRRLTPSEREELLKPYLPPIPDPSRDAAPRRRHKPKHKRHVRPFVKSLAHAFVFLLISTLFSIWVHVRMVKNRVWHRILALMHYHHRSPEMIEKDVRRLRRVPKHLSVILSLQPEGLGDVDRIRRQRKAGRREPIEGLETMLNDAAELVAWSASAGIPMLSVYEKTGLLKSAIPLLERRISRSLTDYFGASSPKKPTFSLRAPNMQSPASQASTSRANEERSGKSSTAESASPRSRAPHIEILILDVSDGRQTLVDLTRTLASMSQRHKLAPSDISEALIDNEISESVMCEPDLLICFQDRIVLDGYPPWQVRLTEICHVQDNAGGVSYAVFLRGLVNYAGAQFRLGR